MFTSGILSVILIAQPAPLPKLVGTLSVTAGKVRLERSGRDPEWAGKYVRVRIGDKLTVVEKPKATLRIDFSRETFRLPEKGAWLVQERSLKVLDGAAPTLIHREAVRRQVPGAKPPAMAGRIRGGEGSLMPMGTVASSPVTMSWSRAAGAKKSQVELLDAAGKKIWSKDAGSAVSMALPNDKLKPGVWFQVRVVQSGAGNPSVTSTWIRVLPESEKSAVEASERSLRAALAEDPVALGEALGELWASAGMVSRLPEALKLIFTGVEWEKDPEALSKLGTWLESAGFTGAARTEYERAWAAGGREPELKESIERLGGKAELEEWEKLAAERDRLMNEEKYREALPVAEQVVSKLRTMKNESAELGKALTFLGYVHLSLEHEERAVTVVEEAFTLLERVDGPKTQAVADTLALQGLLAFQKRDLEVCQAKWEAAFAIQQELAPESIRVANLLQNLGVASWMRKNLDLAEKRYVAALSIRERLTPGSLEVAALVNNLADIAQAREDFSLAQQRFETALAIYEQIAPKSLRVGATMNRLGNVAYKCNNLALAQTRYESALAIQEALAPGSIGVVAILKNLSIVMQDQNDLDLARQRIEAAIAIQLRLEPGSIGLADSQLKLGNLSFLRGDTNLAQLMYEAALTIQVKLAPNSIDVAQCLNNLGLVASSRGDFNQAQRRFEESLAILQDLAPRSLDVAGQLNNLGNLAYSQRDYNLAQKRFEESLAISRTLAPGSLEEADSLNGLGSVACDRQEYIEAQQRFEQSLAIYEKLVPGSLSEATGLENLGMVAGGSGVLNLAISRFKSAVLIRERIAPNSLPLIVSFRKIATCALAMKDQNEYKNFNQRHVEGVITILSKQGQGYAQELSSIGLEAGNALARTGWLEEPASFYPYLPTLRAAGLTLQTRAKISELAAAADEEVRKARSAVQIATKQETDWATNPRPKEMDEKDWDNELLDRRAKRQSAELKLATVLKEKDPRLASDLKVNLEDIQKNLAPDTALIEFLRVSTWDDKAKKPGPDAYAAFIVRSQGDVKYVRLGDAEETDALVEEWHVQIALANDPNAPEAVQAQTEKELRTLGRKLHDRLIKPLGRLPVNVMLAPDASLHSFPFAALVDGKGKFLVETKALSVVGSGRDLVEKPVTGPPGDIAVLAAPNFGADAQAVEAAGAKASEKIGTTRSFNARGTWDPLPSAAAEGNAVGKQLGVQPIEGAEATEERLLGLVRPRVLHIATHGFFFPPTIDRKDREEMRMTEMIGSGIRVADNPMLRSGLILAGANNDAELRKAGLADGWATALEISLMDLRGTELVVLSACDTGRGQSVGSEGVFGLQRAFRFAGAQTLIVSLFKVPDDSTQALMAHFYNAWKPGSPAGTKLASLRAAQLAMLSKPATRHPRHWAAFVLMGDR